MVEPEETDYEDPMMHNTKMTWYPYADEDDTRVLAPTPTDGSGTDVGGRLRRTAEHSRSVFATRAVARVL